MIRADAAVLIHMKKLNRLPIDRLLHKRFGERNLRISGGGNHARSTAFLDSPGDQFRRALRRRQAQFLIGSKDLDVCTFNLKLVERMYGWHGWNYTQAAKARKEKFLCAGDKFLNNLLTISWFALKLV